jgi:hypothetical protein
MNDDNDTGWVVIGYQTIQDGLVLRFYRDMAAATNHRETLSAGRNGVLVHNSAYLHTIPQDVMAEAQGAFEALRQGRDDDARALCTHRKNGLLAGRIEPIEEATNGR